jgi:hypothetical protein
MKCLNENEANAQLSTIGLMLGNWNQITDIDTAPNKKRSHVKFRAPTNSLKLLNFSRYAAGWIPKGEWKIFQLDNSTNFDPVQTSLFGGLVYGYQNIPSVDLRDRRTFLFNFFNDDDKKTELLVSNLIYLILLFECHGYVVSSGGNAGQILSFQDGFAYFSANDEEVFGAKFLLQQAIEEPLVAPEWIQEIIKNYQDTHL